jgi:hypothetical protein
MLLKGSVWVLSLAAQSSLRRPSAFIEPVGSLALKTGLNLGSSLLELALSISRF